VIPLSGVRQDVAKLPAGPLSLPYAAVFDPPPATRNCACGCKRRCRTVIHHARDEAGTILTRIVRDGPVRLDPPGLVLDGIFPADRGPEIEQAE
jgi:hypothetical protein